MTRTALRRSGQVGVRPGQIALTIIHLADAGEIDPDRLCEIALRKLGRAPQLVALPDKNVVAV
jgi:hypothetical protein